MNKLVKKSSILVCLSLLTLPFNVQAKVKSVSAFDSKSASEITYAMRSIVEPPFTVFFGVGHVNGDNVNFRTGPGTSYTSLGQLNKGDIVKAYSSGFSGEKGNWDYCYSEDLESWGYIYWEYVTIDEPA